MNFWKLMYLLMKILYMYCWLDRILSLYSVFKYKDKVFQLSKISREFETFSILFPFRYLDRYKDVKEIQEEVLKEKLKRTSPFKGPIPQPKYPNIYRIPMSKPKWLRTKIEKMRLGEEQWKDLYQWKCHVECISGF